MGIYMSVSHTKGNYQKELADMYHIYAMDQDITRRFFQRKESLFLFAFKQVKISRRSVSTKGEVLKYQIRRCNMKQQGIF